MSGKSQTQGPSLRSLLLQSRRGSLLLGLLLSMYALGGCGSSENQPPPHGCLQQVNEDGFGSHMNRYSWSMAVFNEHLYVGTYNLYMMRTLQGQSGSDCGEIWRFDGREWQRVLDKEVLAPHTASGVRQLAAYHGMLYAGMDSEAGCEVWRSPDGTRWEPISQGGFGTKPNKSVRGMAEYQGRLYVGVQNAKTGGEIHAWDGESWAMIADRGITNPGNIVAAEMITWRGLLYIFMWNIHGLEAYTYDGASFHLVIGPGAPIPAGMGKSYENPAATSVYVYRDRLYLGTGDFVNGAEMWRTDDGVNWVQIDQGGLDHPAPCYFWCMTEYHDDLYLGTFQQEPWILTPGNDHPQERGGRLYRLDPDENMEELVGPNGMLMLGGFDNPENFGIRSMAVFQDRLYMGTAQTTIYGWRQGTEVWELDPVDALCDLRTSN